MQTIFGKYSLTIFCLFFSFYSPGQFSTTEITRKKNRLSITTADTARINICLDISNDYRYTNIDSAIWYADKALDLSRSIHNKSAEASALSQKGFIVLETGDLPQSLRYQFDALDLLKEAYDASAIAFALNRIGNIYMELGDFRKSIQYYQESEALFRKLNEMPFVFNELSNIGNVYGLMGMLDSAKFRMQQVYAFSLDDTGRYAITRAEMRDRYGNIETGLGNFDSALLHYRAGIREGVIDIDYRNLASIYLHMAELFFKLGQNDSSFSYARKTIETANSVSWKKAVYEASDLLAKLFNIRNQPDSALIYSQLSAAVKDSLYGPGKVRTLQGIMLDEQQKQQQLEKERIQTAGKIRMYSLLGGIGVLLIVAALLYRDSIHRKKANLTLQKQKEEIERQKKDIETALSGLKSAQAQLIQSEKMASLGELTAGIAHEIQNPLNFVNNFSELNQEMLGELKAERLKPKDARDEQLEDQLITHVLDNSDKINHHGKRADAIVKGMLQHSRISSGRKELTDLNDLCDEYLRLAYHGLRAKDKSFNAKFESDFDPAVRKINIVPQDMGRVILNLINNAFYAVSERQKAENLKQNSGYEPTVRISTKRLNNKVTIKIKDNGIGIPEKILDKVFQPFFTTKPTGQGTGLGLSLSYDIVKAHGGELRAETKEGEFTEFVIVLSV